MKGEGIARLDRRARDGLANRGHWSREPEQCRCVEKCPGERGQQGPRPDYGSELCIFHGQQGGRTKGRVSEMKLEGDQDWRILSGKVIRLTEKQ